MLNVSESHSCYEILAFGPHLALINSAYVSIIIIMTMKCISMFSIRVFSFSFYLISFSLIFYSLVFSLFSPDSTHPLSTCRAADAIVNTITKKQKIDLLMYGLKYFKIIPISSCAPLIKFQKHISEPFSKA
jgi:hypothetical protein